MKGAAKKSYQNYKPRMEGFIQGNNIQVIVATIADF